MMQQLFEREGFDNEKVGHVLVHWLSLDNVFDTDQYAIKFQ